MGCTHRLLLEYPVTAAQWLEKRCQAYEPRPRQLERSQRLPCEPTTYVVSHFLTLTDGPFRDHLRRPPHWRLQGRPPQHTF